MAAAIGLGIAVPGMVFCFNESRCPDVDRLSRPDGVASTADIGCIKPSGRRKCRPFLLGVNVQNVPDIPTTSNLPNLRSAFRARNRAAIS